MGYGGRTCAEFLVDIRLPFGNPSTTVYADAYITRLLNLAYITDVCMNFDLPDLNTNGTYSLTSGTYSIDVTAAMLKVYSVIRGTDLQVLEASSREDLDRLFLLSNTQIGPPEKWAADVMVNAGRRLFIWPRSDQAYLITVVGKERPTALSASNVTILANDWDDVITDFARARFARDLRLPADADMWMQSAQSKSIAIFPNVIRASDTKWSFRGHGLLK